MLNPTRLSSSRTITTSPQAPSSTRVYSPIRRHLPHVPGKAKRVITTTRMATRPSTTSRGTILNRRTPPATSKAMSLFTRTRSPSKPDPNAIHTHCTRVKRSTRQMQRMSTTESLRRGPLRPVSLRNLPCGSDRFRHFLRLVLHVLKVLGAEEMGSQLQKPSRLDLHNLSHVGLGRQHQFIIEDHSRGRLVLEQAR